MSSFAGYPLMALLANIPDMADDSTLAMLKPVSVQSPATVRFVNPVSSAAMRCSASAGSRLPLNRGLKVAAALARALGDVHRAGLVHRDINPSNLLVGAGDEIQIIDFGLATRVQGQGGAVPVSEALIGTLRYLAPEQTGRLDRPVDWRSDLYSLGATLFELFAGQPPFPTTDPVDLVHAHIARPPPPLTALRPDAPNALQAVIERLLAKSADDRYLSAHALARDLDRIAGAVSEGRVLDGFVPGSDDHPERFTVLDRLYGRTAERDRLLSQFAEAASGAAAVTAVVGPSGIGKSALVAEVRRAISEQRGFFAEGKFDQLGGGLPYSSLLAALDSLLRQVLGQPESTVEAWTERLSTAVGGNGGVVATVLPVLEAVIGPQAAPLELPAEDARHRWLDVFPRFVRALATEQEPLVLFLDDLQWADQATLELLDRVLRSDDCRHLLLLVAWRPDEVGDTHPLQGLLRSLRQRGASLETVELGPLKQADVAALAADALRRDVADCAGLAEVVTDKTGGAPFFVRAFLERLAADGLLELDADSGGWTWALDAVRSS